MPPTTRSQGAREVVATRGRVTQNVLVANSSVRPRREAMNHDTHPSSGKDKPDEPPRFIIDLSLPPQQRYTQTCTHFKEQMQGLTSLFDEVVGDFARFIPILSLHRICQTLLRRVYDNEENEELKGISEATKVPMYLLVCFNVLLDLFMGCSSGGVVVRNGNERSKMVHFRTLDWGMDPLRGIVVQLDFTTETGGPVVASSITYAGYVGVLTGVRKDLSMSLNFRPNRHDRGKFWQDLRYNWHLLMVLLGRRRSISSQLRRFLLPSKFPSSWVCRSDERGSWRFWRYVDIVSEVSGKASQPLTTSACYLCFSDGTETTVLEKDRVTAIVHASNDFVVITNNDFLAGAGTTVGEGPKDEPSEFAAALAEIVHEAKDRRQCAEHNYHNMRAKKAQAVGIESGADLKSILDVDDIVEMVQLYPTLNETSHYACVMDATEGGISWCRRWRKPISAKWIRTHRSDTW